MDWFRPTVALAAVIVGCSIDLPPLEPVTDAGGAGTGGTGATDGSFPGDATDSASGGDATMPSDGAPEADSPSAPPSCASILAADPSAANGVHAVTLPKKTIKIYCDMGGGGWTLAFMSNKGASGKMPLKDFYADMGTGSVEPIKGDNIMYAIEDFASVFHYPGVELRLTWACGTNYVLYGQLGSNFVTLNSGMATWRDDRPSVLGNPGGLNSQFSFFNWSGSSCWNATVDASTVYGFALGATDLQSFIGWFAGASTAITDGLNKDDLPGTVAGWFR